MKKNDCHKVLKSVVTIASSIAIGFLFVVIADLFFPIVLHSDDVIKISDISISKNTTSLEVSNDDLMQKAKDFFYSTLTLKDYVKLNNNPENFVEYIVSFNLTNISDKILFCFNLKSDSSAKILVSKNLYNIDINWVYSNDTENISIVVYSTDDLMEDDILEYCLNNIEITFLKNPIFNNGFIIDIIYHLLSNVMCFGVSLTK